MTPNTPPAHPPLIVELEKLFYELSGAYGSQHADDPEKVLLACCQTLRKAIMQDGQTRETLLQKVKLLRQKAGDYKTKFSVQVLDRFWLKQLTAPIQPVFYKPDEPVL